MNASESLSAGLKALPNKTSSFASTQAAWRFYSNDSVNLSKLQEPLRGLEKLGSLWLVRVKDDPALEFKGVSMKAKAAK